MVSFISRIVVPKICRHDGENENKGGLDKEQGF